MIVFIDGLSGLGKTTLINNLLADNPDWLVFKGLGAVNVAFKEQGQQYNFSKHQIISRLDECNGFKKVILWDRGLSEPIYSTDEFYVSEITRVIRSHYKAIGILLTTETPSAYTDLVLDTRSKNFTQREGNMVMKRWDKYNSIVSGMTHMKAICDLDNPYPNKEAIQAFIDDKLINMESRSNYRNE